MGKVHVELGERSYDIQIQSGGLSTIVGEWADRVPVKTAMIVSDETVWDLYGHTVSTAMKNGGIQASVFVIQPGEKSKHIDVLKEGWNACFEAGLDRRSHIVALGGGVVGDLSGFLAASFMRGIPFIQIPTTLLAQVDSSVGGKTGINHERGKNTIGAFHQPATVLIDVATLDTLDDRQLKAGMAEVIKYGVIQDETFFTWLEDNAKALLSRDSEALVGAVEKCCGIKALIVTQDEKESGIRAILNYGHTFGHAIETATGYEKYLHGEAVGIGMRLAGELSVKLDLWMESELSRQQALLELLGVEFGSPGISGEVIRNHMGTDKKTVAGVLKLILPTSVGSVEIVSEPDEDALADVLENA